MADFESPFNPTPPGSGGSSSSGGGGGVSEDAIAIVMSLGFTRDQAVRALQATVRRKHSSL